MEESNVLQGIWKRLAAVQMAKLEKLNIWKNILDKLDITKSSPQHIDNFERKEVTAPNGSKQWVLKNPDMMTYVKLDEREIFLFDQMDGTRTVSDLFAAVSQKYEKVSPQLFSSLLEKLYSNGFLAEKKITVFSDLRDAIFTRSLKNRILKQFNRRFEFKNLDSLFTWLYKHIFWLFYTLPVRIVLIAISLAGAGFFIALNVKERIDFVKFAGSYSYGLIALLILLSGMVLFHELGHAFTVKHYGREVKKAGMTMCLFYPTSFYVNTDDMWMEESKKAKIGVSWAGLFVNLVFGGYCAIIVAAFPDWPFRSLFFAAALISYILFFLNINPFMSSDGYFMLADFLDISSLRARSAHFVRKVLPLKLKLIWFTKTSKIKEAFNIPKKEIPLLAFMVGTKFSREEKIFTLYGLFTLLWSLAGALLILGFYIFVFGFMKDMWESPHAFVKIVIAVLSLGLVSPAVFILFRLSKSLYKLVHGWLESRHVLDDVGAAIRFFTKLSAFVVVFPVLANLLFPQSRAVRMITDYWFLILQVVACLFGVYFSRKIVLSKEPPRRKLLFRSLIFLLFCFLAAGVTAFIIWHTGQLSYLGFVLTAVTGFCVILTLVLGIIMFSLNGIEGGSFGERVAMALIMFSAPVVALLTVKSLEQNGVQSVMGVLTAGLISVALLSVMLMLPTVFTFKGTELKSSWLMIFSGLLISLGWNSAALYSGGVVSFGIKLGMQASHLASMSLLAMGVGFYFIIYGKGKFARKKREKDVFLPLPARLSQAFHYIAQATLDTFANYYGRRKMTIFEKNFNNESVKNSLEISVIDGKVIDRIPESQNMIELGMSYREVLNCFMAQISEKAGIIFSRKALSKVYDELYWDERELVTAYVFKGTDWEDYFVDSRREEKPEPKTILPEISLFFDFSSEEIAEICSLLKLEKFGPDETVMREGDPADRMYLVRSGKLDVLRNQDGKDIRVVTIGSGDYFGEAALLKDEPRNATIKTLTNVDLFVLEKKDFYHWIKPRVADPQQLIERMNKERFLQSVPLFSGLSSFQLSMVTAKFKLEIIPEGTTFIRQGDAADKFYVIEHGLVEVSSADSDGKTMSLGERGVGECLGEIALIKGGMRSASVVAKTDLKLLVLSKSDFNSLMTKYISVSQKLELVASRRRRLDKDRFLSA